MIDIHLHTNYSDGTFTVHELLKEAESKKLSLLSITDHNNIDAYYELKNSNIRNLFKGNIIPGVEITTTYKGEIIEVLGYGFKIDIMKSFLDDNVLTFEQKQLKEFELMKKQYKKIGIIFDEKNIIFNPKIESCRAIFKEEITKHKENHKFFLYKASITEKKGFTRNEVYNPKSPLYVNLSNLFPSLEKVIDMIHNSGGLAFLAHTFQYSSNIEHELINILDNYNLDGLECFYTTFTKEQTNYLVDLCSKRNLFMSGGSDFHGTNKTNHNLGIGSGNLNIDENVVKPWTKRYNFNKKNGKYK